MNRFIELLETEECLLLDGAMGTMLMSAGLNSGNPPEEWNILHPERIRNVHQAYVNAGSRVILTNSFGGTRYRLNLHNLQDRVVELNKAAAQNARAVADQSPQLVAVAGSIGPTGQLLEPLGTISYDEMKNAFAEQAKTLDDDGVDVFWIETMSDLNEVKAAVEAIRSVSALPIAATMTFDTHGHTMMGVSPKQAMETLSQFDIIVLGANCGNGPAEIEEIIRSMHDINPEATLIAKANAGLPKLVGKEIVFDGTPELMAKYAQNVRSLGATLIGACCGSTPDHIRAMAAALKRPQPRPK
ncbi:MAG: betaine--homocysteine S-methyltransferase [Anaerolineales bacterium]|jgi:5-methyltetrahydrofolate--homocysteine methyltransferase